LRSGRDRRRDVIVDAPVIALALALDPVVL